MPRHRMGVPGHDFTVMDGKGRVTVNSWVGCCVYCEDGTGGVGNGNKVNGLRYLASQ